MNKKLMYWLNATYRALDGHPRGLTTTQVARRIRLDIDNTERLLTHLERCRYIEVVQITPRKRWTNGQPRDSV